MLQLLDTAIAAAGVVLAAWIAGRQARVHKKLSEFYDRWSSNGD